MSAASHAPLPGDPPPRDSPPRDPPPRDSPPRDPLAPAAPPDPLLGRVLAGSYRLEAVLGQGAMGRVYRAAHTLIPQHFAVKVLHPELAEDEDIKRRFLQEARALMLFSHRNVVPVRHCGEEQGLVFLAMDFCPGETLESAMARAGAFPEPRAVAIALQILAAFEEAHRGGIVHRDLKPANVMLESAHDGDERGERVRVLDFGLARILSQGRDAAVASRVSSLGEVVGTVAYMSPEQALGLDLDGRSDLFSLGVLLFELVEGRHPFLGGTMASVITRLIEVRPLDTAPDMPRRASEGLQRVLGHALQKDVAHRFPDAATFAAALKDLAAGVAIERPYDARADARQRSRRRGALLGAGALALVALGAWGLASVATRGPGSDSPARATRDADAATAGAQALARGDWRAAVLALDPLVVAGTASAEQRLQLAQARLALADPELDRDLHALERLLPEDARVSVLRGRYQHRLKGDPERAMSEFAGALVRERKSVEAREARLDLLLDEAHAGWFEQRRANRLAQAMDDVAALAAAGAAPARVALARSRVELAAAGWGGEPGFERTARDAAASAAQACAADPLWADPCEQEAIVALQRAHSARMARRPADAWALAREALEAASRAVKRAVDHPTHRAQGGRLIALRRLKLKAAMHVGDGDAIATEVHALQALEPADAVRLTEQAFSLRTAGQFEEAVLLYETLREIAPDGAVLGDLAFCQQRIGLTRLLAGEREAGVAALTRAVTIYDEALAFSPQAVLRAYRGETLGMLARWDSARTREHLARAQRDLDEALVGASAEERQEALFRRCAVRFQAGNIQGAYADIAEAVEGKPALNPAFHGRMARVALALLLAQRSDPPGPGAAGAPDLYQVALTQAQEAESRSGTEIGPARLLKAQIRLLAGPSEAAATALADIDAALAPGALPAGDLTTEARLWRVLALALPGAPAQALLAARREQLARGQDVPPPAFDTGLAALAEAAGATGLAALARDLATRRP